MLRGDTSRRTPVTLAIDRYAEGTLVVGLLEAATCARILKSDLTGHVSNTRCDEESV